MNRHACLLALIAAATIGVSATEPNAATRRWWGHVVALSGDDLQGRDTGSEGHRRAARYVARQLEQNGVTAAGEDGFFQRVPIRALNLARDRSRASFNDFFARLVTAIANADQAPAWKPGSPLAPRVN